ncbi:LCP family protein [Merdimonas faecis]|uniref:LCP family protein n=1 Tax=Merdimonas faecis TaxID=1653435 RepID=UPI0023FA1831|nr:LCP family protein [Merdimonas faecis]
MRKKISKAERKKIIRKRRRKRILLLVTEVIILAALSVVAYGIFKMGKLDINILDDNKLEAYHDTGEYTNIALFGLDSREGQLGSGTQSDCIMIASINNETNEVKLISVYRDTLLRQADGTYEKANSAYNTGGPEAAVSLLNRNFDLDIRNYVSVDFSALVEVIDLLGGIDLDMTEEEVKYCNQYAYETAIVSGKTCEDIEIKDGVQHVDGVHAVGYARIRYTDGNDFKRTERQREVLQIVAQKAQEANILTLNEIVNTVFPMISTSLTIQDMLGFAAHALDYKIVETSGFPYKVTTDENVMNHTGSYVIPVGFTNNVIQLHQNLFAESDYQPSETVSQVNDDIIYLTGITEDAEAMKTTFDEDISEDAAESE